MINMKITSHKTASKILSARKEHVDALLSIGTEGSKLPAGFRNAPTRLRLEFDDVEVAFPNIGAPTETDIKAIISFAHRLLLDNVYGSGGNLLIHCQAGISRSTAAGFIMQCIWLGEGKEEEAMRKVIDAAVDETPDPNRLMVQIADNLLKSNRSMVNTRSAFFDTSSMY